MAEWTHRMMMLRPMQTGLSGYARLQWERDRALIQMNVRGVKTSGFRAFWYSGGGEARELGVSPGNGRGEAALTAEIPMDRYAPDRLQALMIVENALQPRPLLIGLCAGSSAGSLLDVKNASLALCEKLGRTAGKQKSGTDKRKVPSAPRERAEPPQAAKPPRPENRPSGGSAGERPLPREIFLPALDPAPYIQAREDREALTEKESLVSPQSPAAETPKKPSPPGEPAGRLPELQWPKAFASLKEYFDRCLPCALFELPGWRFVQVSDRGDGLWIGRQSRNGRVCRVAYAMRGAPPREDSRPYQKMQGRDGSVYRVLWQRI